MDVIRVKMAAPFGDNKWCEIDLLREMKMAQLLERLGATFPKLNKYFDPKAKETLYQMLLIRDGQVLKLSDLVWCEDRITIMLPVDGG